MKNRETAKALHYDVRVPSLCPNCKHPGSHFVAPMFGEQGFYVCEWLNETDEENLPYDRSDSLLR